MPDLTLKELFGDSVIYDATSKEITFSINEIAGQDFDTSNVTEANCNKCASKILWALLNHLKNVQPSKNTEPDRGIYITNQGRRTVTRGGVSQFCFQLTVNGYSADTVGTKLPVDNLVLPKMEKTNG